MAERENEAVCCPTCGEPMYYIGAFEASEAQRESDDPTEPLYTDEPCEECAMEATG